MFQSQYDSVQVATHAINLVWHAKINDKASGVDISRAKCMLVMLMLFVPMGRKDLFSLSTLHPSRLLTDIQNKRHFESLLKDLKSNVPDSTIFLHKVSKKEAPTYYDVIKNPMDLGTMNKKLPLYDTKTFCDDLDLIWENCFYFNRGSPFFVGCAERMKARADSLKSFYFGNEDVIQWTQFREFRRARRIGKQRRADAILSGVSYGQDELCTQIQPDILSRGIVRIYIARILRKNGFSTCTKCTLDILADVFIFYIQKRIAAFLSIEPREW